MIHRALNIDSEGLNGTTALRLGLDRADLLRAHDVREAVECVRLRNTFTVAIPADAMIEQPPPVGLWQLLDILAVALILPIVSADAGRLSDFPGHPGDLPRQ